MSVINKDTKEFWQEMADKLSKNRPYPGRQVSVVKGNKHKGKVGNVTKHQIDKFANTYRYGGEASHHMRDLEGRKGWVCMVDTGKERFWVKAHYLHCEGADPECKNCGSSLSVENGVCVGCKTYP